MDWLVQMFGEAQQRLFEGVVQPFLFHFGMANLLEDGYTATGWLLVGLLQIAVMVAVIVPLQRWRPVEPVVDRQAIRVDILYTLIHRLGLFRLALFFTTEPLWNSLMGQLHVWGLPGFHLDDLWPGVTDNAWVSLLMYLVVFDLVYTPYRTRFVTEALEAGGLAVPGMEMFLYQAIEQFRLWTGRVLPEEELRPVLLAALYGSMPQAG